MNADEKLRITVKLSGVAYPVTILRKDEEKYRRAEVIVNKMVTSYKNTFRANPENYFAMAALHASVENVGYLMNNVEASTVDQLLDLEKQLDSYIENIQK